MLLSTDRQTYTGFDRFDDEGGGGLRLSIKPPSPQGDALTCGFSVSLTDAIALFSFDRADSPRFVLTDLGSGQ